MRVPSSRPPFWVDLSRENLTLADRELRACVATIDPQAPAPVPVPGSPSLREVQLSGDVEARELAHRIGFAHLVLRPLADGPVDVLIDAIGVHGALGESARVRVAPGAPGTLSRTLPPVLGHAFVQAGGRVDLETPQRDFLAYILAPEVADPAGQTEGALVEILAEVPRSEVESHRSKHRPFRKPVTLPPRLARALVNLAQVVPGGRVLDPFCGTGAILIEAGHLGYRVVGADLSGDMVKGTLLNLEASGLTPERVVQSGISDLPELLRDLGQFDGVVCDPPYGRSATTGGKGSVEVLRDTIQALPALLRPGARAVLLVASPELPCELAPDLEEEYHLEAQRVHRSLTRHILVLRRR